MNSAKGLRPSPNAGRGYNRSVCKRLSEISPRISIRQALSDYQGSEITVLIGPEGDFSPEEARLALKNGYLPIHLGASRLRTETAALTAVEAVYLHFISG